MPLELNEALSAQSNIDLTKQVPISEIPVVSVEEVVGEAGDIEGVARRMADAFQSIGFCYISDHGVPQEVIDRAFSVLPAFFGLPEEEKRRIPINLNQRGYLPMFRQTNIHGKKPNRSESFIFGRDLPANDPDRRAGRPLHDTNQWPEGLPEFRLALEEYWRALVMLAHQLLRPLAVSMGQPPDFFEPMYNKPDSLLRCAMYPAAPGPFDGHFGSGPHTDNGVLTILAQDDVGGLQLQNRAGDWIAAPSIPGTFVVNIGDMITRWTNGHFRSTPHRVISGERARYSLPFFYFPDYDTQIAVLDAFVSDEDPPRYEEVHWGRYVVGQFEKNYDHFKTAR